MHYLHLSALVLTCHRRYRLGHDCEVYRQVFPRIYENLTESHGISRNLAKTSKNISKSPRTSRRINDNVIALDIRPSRSRFVATVGRTPLV